MAFSAPSGTPSSTGCIGGCARSPRCEYNRRGTGRSLQGSRRPLPGPPGPPEILREPRDETQFADTLTERGHRSPRALLAVADPSTHISLSRPPPPHTCPELFHRSRPARRHVTNFPERWCVREADPTRGSAAKTSPRPRKPRVARPCTTSALGTHGERSYPRRGCDSTLPIARRTPCRVQRVKESLRVAPKGKGAQCFRVCPRRALHERCRSSP